MYDSGLPLLIYIACKKKTKQNYKNIKQKAKTVDGEKNKYTQIKSSYLFNKSIHYASHHKQRDEYGTSVCLCVCVLYYVDYIIKSNGIT